MCLGVNGSSLRKSVSDVVKFGAPVFWNVKNIDGTALPWMIRTGFLTWNSVAHGALKTSVADNETPSNGPERLYNLASCL
jgi:hypothetical protein